DRDNGGVSTFSLLQGKTSDVDLDAPYRGNSHNTRSIAIIGQSGSNGMWQYLSDQAAWVELGAVSDTSALLMDPNTLIRFRPDGTNGTSASLTFRAWDGYNDFSNTRLTK